MYGLNLQVCFLHLVRTTDQYLVSFTSECFECMTVVLIAPVPGHCLPLTFDSRFRRALLLQMIMIFIHVIQCIIKLVQVMIVQLPLA